MRAFHAALLVAIVIVCGGWFHGSATVSCPQGNSFSDGCAGAPFGTAVASGLFTGGTGTTGTNYLGTGGVRPAWNVAGVDYHVGYPTNITLTDPATVSCAGGSGCSGCPTNVSCNSTNHTWTVSGATTINGFDFSLENGWFINITATTGTVTIKNSYFLIGSNFGSTGIYMIDNTSTANLTLTANTIDGNGCNFTHLDALVNTAGGVLTSTYNQYLNSPQHDLQFLQTGTGNTSSSQFDYFRVVGYTSGAHANPYLFDNSGDFSSFVSEFNTIIIPGGSGDASAVGNCPASSAIAGSGSSGNEYFASTGHTLAGVAIENNTLIASVGGGGFDTFLVRMDSGTVSAPTITNNYYDAQGVLTAHTPYNLTNASSPTISGNILLTNGNLCNSNGAGCT